MDCCVLKDTEVVSGLNAKFYYGSVKREVSHIDSVFTYLLCSHT